MCFYGWVLGPPMVYVPSPCVSMDAALGPPIAHVLFPCVSMDGVSHLLLFMHPLHVFVWIEVHNLL